MDDFRAARDVIPSFSLATFPSQHGIVGDVGGGESWSPAVSDGPKQGTSIRLTDPENLQPLGFASLAGVVPRHILPVPRPEGDVDESVTKMRRAALKKIAGASRAEDHGDEDEHEAEDGEKLYFVLTGFYGVSAVFCELDLLRRRSPSIRKNPNRSNSAQYSVDAATVAFETMYEQECSLVRLWELGDSQYRGRSSLVASSSAKTKTLFASACFSGQQLQLRDVWNGGETILSLSLGTTRPYGVCCHRQTNYAVVAGNDNVIAFDLTKGKRVWDAHWHFAKINPRSYELFSIEAPPPTAHACQNSVFVGAHGHLSMLDIRMEAAPLLQRATVGYVRDIAFSDRLLCYLHGPRISVCDLRMLAKDDCVDVGIANLHPRCMSSGRDGGIVPLPNECFISVPPGSKRHSSSSGMTKWGLSQGRVKILKETNWPANGASYFPSAFAGHSFNDRVEMEERIGFSLSFEYLGLLALNCEVARIKVPRSLL